MALDQPALLEVLNASWLLRCRHRPSVGTATAPARPELLVVVAAHPHEEVQNLSAERSDTGHGGAGQHMGAAAGGTDGVAAIHPEVRKNRGCVGRAVGDGPAQLA